MRKGKKLAAGDTVGLTAPAGPLGEAETAEAVAKLEAMGFRVRTGDTCRGEYGGYLSAPRGQRAAELNGMFADEAIAGIFCLRGGYGSAHLLPLLDYQLAASQPKLFIGYSDITALHIAYQQNSGLATIHGPMPGSDLRNADVWTEQSLLEAVTSSEPLGKIRNPCGETIECLYPGEAEGIITGGNLSVISGLMGTPYELDAAGKLLFLEDIGEPPYKVDRMLTQLALSGAFEKASGIILGTWTGCNAAPSASSFQVLDLFESIIAPWKKPAVYNVIAGHGGRTLTLPFGVRARLNAARGELELLEGAAD